MITGPKRRANKASAAGIGERWILKLYVAGQTPKSSAAFDNLKRACEENLKGRYAIEVIDLLKNPRRAKDDHILVIPTVIRKLPRPMRRIIGDLSNTDRVLIGLDLGHAGREEHRTVTKGNRDAKLLSEVVVLRSRLADAEETLRAIGSGEADALVSSRGGKQTVQLIGEGDRVYRQFLETRTEGTATVSVDGVIRSCNAAMTMMMGRPLGEVLGTDLRDHLLPEDREAFGSVLTEAGTESYRFIVRLMRPDGVPMPVYASATLLEGSEPGYCLLFWDHREIISTESTLRESKALYREMLDLAPVGIAVLFEGKIVYINPAGAHIVGADSEDQVIGKSIEAIVPPDRKEFVRLQMAMMIAGKIKSDSVEDTILRLDGTSIDADILASPIEYAGKSAVQLIFTDITERKREKAELEFRNILLSTQQEVSIDAILVVDENAHILSYNRKFIEMWYIPATLLDGKDDEPILSLVSDLVIDRKEFVDRVKFLYEHPKETSHDELLLKDGRVIERYSAPMFGTEDSYLGRVWYFRDITRRKQAEADLYFHQSILEETGRIAKVGGWSFDAISGEGFWTEEVARIHDVDPSQSTSKEVGLQYYVGESRVRIEGAVKDAVVRGVPFDLELNLVSAKGISKWVRTIGHPVMKDAVVTGVMGSFQDITERKQAEFERERLTSAIEQVVETVVITDTKGTIQYVNPAFETVTGYTRDEVLGTNESIPRSGGQDQEFYRELWATISSGEIWRGTIINKRKDGKPYTMESSISPVRDPAGRIVNYVMVNHDMSAQRLIEARLRQAEKMETVGQLAGGVAHDFNNMLQVIITYTDMALSIAETGERLHKYLIEIRRAAQRSAEITGQLLAFARKEIISPKIVDLNDSVSGAQKMIKRLIGESIDVAWMPGRDLWKLEVDPTQLDQILANLAVNARDAIGGVGKLTIGTQNVTLDEAFCAEKPGLTPGEYLLLSVSDDGRGMDKETLSHLFEPFFTTKDAGKGTGLGLATVYGIVKQNNGYISVYSEPGDGSTFKVYLPRAEAAAGEYAVDVEPEFSRGGTETVLVVEDEGAILELARESLEQLGYTVLAAGSPEEAIRSSETHAGPIHLLLTDVVMPQMNGRQLSERLIASRPQLKCLYMSGYTADVMGHRRILDEEMKFIAKPFSLAVLAEKIREVMDS